MLQCNTSSLIFLTSVLLARNVIAFQPNSILKCYKNNAAFKVQSRTFMTSSFLDSLMSTPEEGTSDVSEDISSTIAQGDTSTSGASEVGESVQEEPMKIFIGGLPTSYDEDVIRGLFAPHGEVLQIFVPTDRETGQPRGFAFLEMSKESGVSAVGALDQITIEDRVIKCNEQLSKEELANRKESRANEGVKIYVGNVSFETTKEQLVECFEQYGTVSDCYVPLDSNTGMMRGFAFIRMPNEEESNKAIESSNGEMLGGRDIEVSVSLPRGQAPPRRNRNRQPPNQTKIYVGNLPFETDADELTELFQDFGTVNDCYMPEDRMTGRGRGFGFISMPTEDAEGAIEELDGFEFGGRMLRVNEAIPIQKKDRFDDDNDSF
jgi:RNA recognition motif-containing protein